jgi:hypothetical protein
MDTLLKFITLDKLGVSLDNSSNISVELKAPMNESRPKTEVVDVP